MKTYAVPSSNEIAQTVQVMTKETDVIYIPTDNTIANAMQTVVGEANRTKTPIIPSSGYNGRTRRFSNCWD